MAVLPDESLAIIKKMKVYLAAGFSEPDRGIIMNKGFLKQVGSIC
jgi:hypothetical protein